MLRLYAFLFGLHLLSATTDDCPGWCGHPLEKLVIWTDNPNIWRCELPSVTVTRCSDVATVECLRLDDLGGDLYIMLFPASPNVIGIDPDYLAKGRVDMLNTTIHCKNGSWTLPENNIRMTHLLCDQYIIDQYKAQNSKNKPLPPLTSDKTTPSPPSSEKTPPEDDLLVTDVKVAEVFYKAGSPGGAYVIPFPLEPVFPKNKGVGSTEPPNGAYLLPTPPAGVSMAKEEVAKPPTLSPSTPEAVTYASAVFTPYSSSTVTATLVLFTSTSSTTTTTPAPLTHTSTSTVPLPESTTHLKSTSSSLDKTTSATSGTTSHIITSTATSTTTKTTSPSSTPKPASTNPTIPTTTSSTDTTNTSSVRYTTEKNSREEQEESTTLSSTSRRPPEGSTTSVTTEESTTILTTAGTAEPTSSRKPFVNLSITFKEPTSPPVVNSYGDETIEAVKPRPQRAWSRGQRNTVNKKASLPKQVRIGSRKPPAGKIANSEKFSTVQARPLHKEHMTWRNSRKRTRGRLVKLPSSKTASQQREQAQATKTVKNAIADIVENLLIPLSGRGRPNL